MSCTGSRSTKSTSPESSAATRVASCLIGVKIDLVDVAFDLAPLVGVAHDTTMRLSGSQRSSDVRAGAVGVARGVGLFLLRVVLRLASLFFSAPRLAHDAEVDDVRAGAADAGPSRLEVDRVVVDLPHFLDAGDVDLQSVPCGCLMRPKENTTSSAVNGRAVVELDALAQVEAPLRVGRSASSSSRGTARAGSPCCSASGLVDVLHDRVRGRVVLRVRVHRQRCRSAPPISALTAWAGATTQRQDEQVRCAS